MKALNKQTGQLEKVYVKALDSMPVGTVVEFNGQASDIPSGWEETTDPNSYSTNEIKTNKTWIDGKPIYRKVLELTNVPRGYKNHLHNISNLGDITNVYGRFKESDVQNPVVRVVADNITTYGIGVVDINATEIHTLLGSGVSTTNTMKVVLEYTKTTD